LSNKPAPSEQELVSTLVKKGQKKGSLTYSEIATVLEEVDIDKDQLDDIYDSLTSMGIEVISEEDDSSDDSDDIKTSSKTKKMKKLKLTFQSLRE